MVAHVFLGYRHGFDDGLDRTVDLADEVKPDARVSQPYVYLLPRGWEAEFDHPADAALKYMTPNLWNKVG